MTAYWFRDNETLVTIIAESVEKAVQIWSANYVGEPREIHRIPGVVLGCNIE